MWRNVALMLIVTLLAAPGAAAARQRGGVEPQAGAWRTWLLSSGSELRLPPPPNRAATQAELRTLRDLAAQRGAAAEQIARWTSGGPAYRWNELAREVALKRGITTPPGSRIFAALHVAIYDATIAAWDTKYAYNRPRPSVQRPALGTAAPVPNSPAYPAEHAVVSAAAAGVLSFFFPNDAAFFAAQAAEAGQAVQIAGLNYPSDVAAGAQIGAAVAERVIARVQSDGFGAPWEGSVPEGPGYWVGSNPVLPNAGNAHTWALTSGSEFRPGPPPAFGSAELEAEMQELRDFQRTPQTNALAFFWEYGAGGARFYIYWNELLARKVLEYGLADNPPRAAQAFLLPNVAMYDSFVACWDAKYAYWLLRPNQLDPSFATLYPNPNYPAYPAGMACLSTAVSVAMGDLFPRDLGTFYALAEQAAESRIAAGIHFRSDIRVGRDLGWAVGQRVIGLAER
jgi:membrane-associated phospholipid phosphatase